MVVPVTTEDAQVISRPAAVQSPPARRSRPFLLSGIIGVLLVLLVGGGILTVVGTDWGSKLSGESEPPAPPDPAFDPLLSPLASQTTAPIMLPAELPNELKNVGVNENLEGDSYGLTFLSTPPGDPVGTWANAETIGSLEAVPASEFEQDQRFEATSTEDVELSDGTQAELSLMEPVSEAAMYGPQWEGTFDKGRYTYTLTVLVGQDGYVVSKQALSTMVEYQGDG